MLGRVAQWEEHTWELEFASGLLTGEHSFLPGLYTPAFLSLGLLSWQLELLVPTSQTAVTPVV